MDASSVNAVPMDLDELFAKAPGDPLALVCREDLGRYSVHELEQRIAALEAEIARCRRRCETAVNHRATADELFRR